RLPRATGRAIGPAVEQVLTDPDRVEPEVLDRLDHVEQLGPADLALDLRELDANLERPAVRRHGHASQGTSMTRPLTRSPCIRHPAPDMDAIRRFTRRSQRGPQRAIST